MEPERYAIMAKIRLSKHAIDRYRERILACPERHREDGTIASVIRKQIVGVSPKQKGDYFTIKAFPNTVFVGSIPDNVIMSTLGFMMRPNFKRKLFKPIDGA